MALSLGFKVEALSSITMTLLTNKANLTCRTSCQRLRYQPRLLKNSRDDPWTTRDKCHIVKGLHLSKECIPTEGLREVLLRHNTDQAWIVSFLATGLSLATPTRWHSEEAAHHPCVSHFKNRLDKVLMVHRYNNKDLQLMDTIYSGKVQTQTLSHHTPLLFARVTWMEVLGFLPSLHLSAKELHRRLINAQCLWINRPNRSLDRSSIDCELPSMRIRTTANKLYY